MQGSNLTSIPTSQIQTNLGGLKVDNQYGPQTTTAVKAFQAQNGLLSDGIFGPKTQAVYNAKFPTTATASEALITPGGSDKGVAPMSNLITTSASTQNNLSKNSTDLAAALAKYGATPVATDPKTGQPTSPATDPNAPKPDPVLTDTISGTANDPFIQELNTMHANSDVASKVLIQNIIANKDKQANAVNTQYNNYKSGLQLLGIQTNEAQVTPDLLASHQNEATSAQEDKISDLNNAEAKALTDAQTAKDNDDFKTLDTTMSYLKSIQAQKVQALKDYQDAITTQAKNSQVQGDANAKLVAPDIYTTLQTLSPDDQEKFLVAVSQKFNIPLNSLVTALVSEKGVQDKANAKTAADADKVLSPAEAKTLGVPYGTTAAQAAKMGITPKSGKSGGGTSSAKTEKEEIATGQTVLKTGTLPDGTKVGNPQGADGFYDPGVYNTLFQAWKGTPKAFIAKYPIVGSVNPLSYTKLPDALQKLLPKAATKTSSTGRSASGN